MKGLLAMLLLKSQLSSSYALASSWIRSARSYLGRGFIQGGEDEQGVAMRTREVFFIKAERSEECNGTEGGERGGRSLLQRSEALFGRRGWSSSSAELKKD